MVKNKHHDSPLMMAVISKHFKLALHMLALDKSIVQHKNKGWKFFFLLAYGHGFVQMIRLIIEACKDVVERDDLEKCRKTFEIGKCRVEFCEKRAVVKDCLNELIKVLEKITQKLQEELIFGDKNKFCSSKQFKRRGRKRKNSIKRKREVQVCLLKSIFHYLNQ